MKLGFGDVMAMVKLYGVLGDEWPAPDRISDDDGSLVQLLIAPSGKFLPRQPKWATVEVAQRDTISVPELVEADFFPEPEIETSDVVTSAVAIPVQIERRLPTDAEAIAQVEAYDAAQREGPPFSVAEWAARKAAEIRKL
ncbi:hypothetical protein ACVDG8_002400 [Mesorhizobium sp. ORM8.1]